jgi:hypothetical protein
VRRLGRKEPRGAGVVNGAVHADAVGEEVSCRFVFWIWSDFDVEGCVVWEGGV